MIEKIKEFFLGLLIKITQYTPHKFHNRVVMLTGKLIGFFRLIRYRNQDMHACDMIGEFIRIDASTICQLQCPICPTANRIIAKSVIGSNYLKFSNFKQFIDQNDKIKTIELSNWGEIFLNPDLPKIIQYAHEHHVSLTAGNGVNLNRASEEVLKAVVTYKFKLINISIDGATNETYKQYRRNGNFDEVIKNIKKINEFKKRYHTVYPILIWQFIIMGHNEHELLSAKKKAKELNMIFFPKLNWDSSYSPIVDKEAVRKNAGLSFVTRDEYFQKFQKDYILECSQFWTSPQINWDGKLLGCCQNMWGDYGNVFEQGLIACLQSEKYQYAKGMILGTMPPREDIPCIKCPTYKNNISITPLTKKDIILSLF
jgi:MoaA/NifB/PqqE/SkfB family radical SAM enzyme